MRSRVSTPAEFPESLVCPPHGRRASRLGQAGIRLFRRAVGDAAFCAKEGGQRGGEEGGLEDTGGCCRTI